MHSAETNRWQGNRVIKTLRRGFSRTNSRLPFITMWLLSAALIFAWNGEAAAQTRDSTRSISMPAQTLSRSLKAIARRFGIDLLYSEDMVAGRSAASLSGRLTPDQALALVLQGSTLTARRTASGSYVIVRAPLVLQDQQEAVSEILVIGKRTQNTDIRRTENDIRPYQVIERSDVERSHVATVEELAAKRLTANAQGATLAQQGATSQGDTESSINLRGLGPAQTLLLIDGRRLPQMPTERTGFSQSDVNALPPEVIERVEAITATAGGIYGPGATAGVINLVLNRDYRGSSLTVTNALTARGDAPYHRIAYSMGFTPDGGDTSVMGSIAWSDFGGLEVGERPFALRRNQRINANYPSYYLLDRPPVSSGLNVVSDDGSPLVLKAAFGGAQLGAPNTFAAPSVARSPDQLAAELLSNAGRFDLSPANNAGGDGETLLSGRRTLAIVGSIRHQSGPYEIFLDYLRLANRGSARTAYPIGGFGLSAANPANPFVQAVTVYTPDPELTISYALRSKLDRTTAGVIFDIGARWRGEIDYSIGSASRALDIDAQNFNLDGLVQYYTQLFVGFGPFDPLGDYSAFRAAFRGLSGDEIQRSRQRNRFRNASIRMSGPVVELGGGAVTATILANERRESVAGGIASGVSPLVPDIPDTDLPAYSERIRSVYTEARAPLIDPDSGWYPLRGLEAQLALRYDQTRTLAPSNRLALDGGGVREVRNAGLVYTGGIKFSPSDGLLVRASVSTGRDPLTVTDLTRVVFAGTGTTLNDPKRPNSPLYTFDQIVGGASDPSPVRARSVSVGLVAQPRQLPDLRVSIDYTTIVRRGENAGLPPTGVDYFLANEASFPERVVRAPLTTDDALLGYTGGRILSVDASSLQVGQTKIDAFDIRVDYRLEMRPAGIIDFHAAATWQPRFDRDFGFGLPLRSFAGASDGAIRLRANGGARWTRGNLALSTDFQFFGRSELVSGIETVREIQESSDIIQQGGRRIPAHLTFDLAAEYRIPLSGPAADRERSIDIRFGVQDVFDAMPAIVVNAPGGYNSYADPRGRRFELALSTRY